MQSEMLSRCVPYALVKSGISREMLPNPLSRHVCMYIFTDSPPILYHKAKSHSPPSNAIDMLLTCMYHVCMYVCMYACNTSPIRPTPLPKPPACPAPKRPACFSPSFCMYTTLPPSNTKEIQSRNNKNHYTAQSACLPARPPSHAVCQIKLRWRSKENRHP